MIKLNSFRLVNVRANNNTIIYPDVTFNLDGKSTLIDAKNGGGKTLAVQMLFQTILPKSSFDGNKTVATLFDNVPNKTTMHSVSSFQLNDDYPFSTLCLGFAISKSQDINTDYDILNYAIEGDNLEDFSLSIDTLNLNHDGKILSINDLKNLLISKSNLNKSSFKVTIFENDVDNYKEYIRRYDINSQVYRFIMNINQTENYIQQYFEKNCRTQQGLLTDFIIPNTISALDDRKPTGENSTQDDISILAQSLLEKSKSLSELKTIESELEEYKKIINMIDSFLYVVKSNKHNFTKYDKSLMEYSKQYTNYSNGVQQVGQELEEVSKEVETTRETIQNLDTDIEYLTTRRIECAVLETQEKLKQTEECYSQNYKDITELQTKYDDMVATNSIIEYKYLENTFQMISEDVSQHVDRNLSSYANTIYDIANMQIMKNEYEMEYVESKISELTLQFDECTQNVGKYKQLLNIAENNIRDWTETLNSQLTTIETLQSELLGYERYSNSLLENEELFSIVDSIKRLSSQRDELTKQKLTLENALTLEQNTTSHLELMVSQHTSLVELYTEKKSSYEEEVSKLRHTLGVEEFEFEGKYNELSNRRVEILNQIEKLSLEVQKYKDSIAIMKKYGLLREKHRYEALEILQSELETACFGLDVIQGNTTLLEKFPALAETVIVSNKDYHNIKTGKIKLPDEVTRENFLIMPYDTIRTINKLTFDDMLLLTRDSEYYKTILDNQATIERYSQKILSLKHRIDTLQGEYDTVQGLCNSIIVHVGKYSFENVQEVNLALEEHQRELKKYTESLEVSKSKMEEYTHQLEEYNHILDDLNVKLTSANDKKTLLNQLITLLSESHKHEVSITSEKKKVSTYQTNLQNLELQVSSLQSRLSSLRSDYVHQTNNVATYKGYILEVENSVNKSVRGVNSKNIELLIQKFRSLKNGTSQTQSDIIKPILNSLMENVKTREVFKVVDFDTLYTNYIEENTLVPFDTENLERCKADLEHSKESLKRYSNFLVAQNNSLELYMAHFDNRLNAEDSQYDDYRKYSFEEVTQRLDDSNAQKTNLDEKLRLLLERQAQLEDTYHQYKLQSELYKFFCVENHLDLNLPCETTSMVEFSETSKKFREVSKAYQSSMDEVNHSVKLLSKSVDELSIPEQIKYTIKNNAILKRSYAEVLTFTERLKSLKIQATAMISNLNTTVENIGRIDEDITEQLYRILTEILDEVSAIPKISKFKVQDSYKETFKINLYEGGKGCRFSQERTKNSIRKYIVSLADDINTQYYDKNTIVELLSIDKIIRFGVDLNRLNVQILKIDQERVTYQNWENVVASTGQEYIMYVLFTITMVKYFNNVMSNTTKTPLFVFLDNPFASASDFQLWQPVKKFLDKNDAQLLCLAHNVPSVSQILFERQIILEQSKGEDGMLINSIRNEKTELKENIQLTLL